MGGWAVGGAGVQRAGFVTASPVSRGRRSRGALVGLAWLGAGAVALLPRPTRAGSETRVAPANTREVHLVYVDVPADDTFPRRLQSFFEDEPRLTFETAAEVVPERILLAPEQPGAEVWVRLRSSSRATVYFVVSANDGIGQRFLVRDVELADGFDELGKERIAQVIYSSLIALWEGSITTPRDEVERELRSSGPDPDAGSPQPRSRQVSLQRRAEPRVVEPDPPGPVEASDARGPGPELVLGAGYGGGYRGPEGWAHGPQVIALAFGGSAEWKPGGFVRAGYHLPVQVPAGELALMSEGFAMRAGAALGARLSTGAALRFVAGLGGGLDQVHYQASGGRGVTPSEGETEYRPVATLLAGVSLASSWATLVLLGGLDLELVTTHYDVRYATGRDAVLVPWRWRPGVSLHGAWRTWGGR